MMTTMHYIADDDLESDYDNEATLMMVFIPRALVSVAGVWGGTARALKVFAIGDNLDSWSVLYRG